jgi:hypothetical protein
MSPDSKIGLLLWSWKETLVAARKPVVLLPFFVYALVQAFIVAGLVFFMYPPFSFLFIPLLRTLGGETALHYPNYFLGLPQAFDLLNLILSGILGVGVIGLAILLFAANRRPANLRARVKLVRGRYGHLLGAWFVETALSLAVIYGCAAWAADAPELGPYLAAARVLGVIFVSALFAFTGVLIVLERQSFPSAIANSLRLFGRYGLPAFVMIGLPALLQLPVQYLLSKSAIIVQKLNPEIIAGVVCAGILAGMISNYLVIGAITNLYRIAAFETENDSL